MIQRLSAGAGGAVLPDFDVMAGLACMGFAIGRDNLVAGVSGDRAGAGFTAAREKQASHQSRPDTANIGDLANLRKERHLNLACKWRPGPSLSLACSSRPGRHTLLYSEPWQGFNGPATKNTLETADEVEKRGG